MYEAIIFIAGFVAGVIASIAVIKAAMSIAADEIVSVLPKNDRGPESGRRPESGRDPEHPTPDTQETKSRWTWDPSTFGRKD